MHVSSLNSPGRHAGIHRNRRTTPQISRIPHWSGMVNRYFAKMHRNDRWWWDIWVVKRNCRFLPNSPADRPSYPVWTCCYCWHWRRRCKRGQRDQTRPPKTAASPQSVLAFAMHRFRCQTVCMDICDVFININNLCLALFTYLARICIDRCTSITSRAVFFSFDIAA